MIMDKKYRKPKIENIKFDDIITTSGGDWQDVVEVIQPPDFSDWSSEY